MDQVDIAGPSGYRTGAPDAHTIQERRKISLFGDCCGEGTIKQTTSEAEDRRPLEEEAEKDRASTRYRLSRS